MLSLEIEITNKLGLHARASAKLAQTASQFNCNTWITRKGRRVNAVSMMDVIMLAAAKGSLVTLEAEGVEAQAAMEALSTLINDKFGEGE